MRGMNIKGTDIPLEVLHQHVAVLGKTGSGKSSVLRLLVEDQLDRQERVCIIDPKGDWWGLNKWHATCKMAGLSAADIRCG